MSPWVGRYSDPNHPTGFRDVTVSGSDLTIVGRDSPTGAEWTLRARVDASGLASTIDFSPKGGPRDLPAKLVSGKIVFPDVRAPRRSVAWRARGERRLERAWAVGSADACAAAWSGEC